jgi:prefoldin subunit 5
LVCTADAKDAEKSGETKDRELQEKMLSYRLMESKLQGLARQRDIIMSKILEVETTAAGIGEIAKAEGGKGSNGSGGSGEIVFSIGSGAYVSVPGKTADKTKTGKTDNTSGTSMVIVEVGGGVALEKTAEEAREFFNGRLAELETLLAGLDGEMKRVASFMDYLLPEIQRGVESAKK